MNDVPFGFKPSAGGDEPDDEGLQPDPAAFDMAALGAALQELGSMLKSGGSTSAGTIDWTLAYDVARKALASAGDPAVNESQRRQVADAMRLADVWLDGATQFPACPGDAQAWSRSEWLEATFPAWKGMIAPVADQFSRTVSQLLSGGQGDDAASAAAANLPAGFPAELAAVAGPLLGMARSLGAATFGMQAGEGLAALAAEVLSSSDIGVPLTKDVGAALVPENIVAFGEGLELPADDVRLFIALREGAHQRLFVHVPWLRSRVEAAIAAYCAGIRVDGDQIERALAEVDPADPESMQRLMAGVVFEPEDTPERRAALARLETILALTEGWVDDVVQAAAAERLPSFDRLSEVHRRRRATGGPAEKTFATLVGLELRPRRLREAASLWAALRQRSSIGRRDSIWDHPDLLPSAADLDELDEFVERTLGE